MLTVAMRSSRVWFSQSRSNVTVGWIAYQGLPTASRRNWQDLRGIGVCQRFSTKVKTTRLTVGEGDECSNVVYKIFLRYGARELHGTLSNQPSLGPELIGERAKVSGVSL